MGVEPGGPVPSGTPILNHSENLQNSRPSTIDSKGLEYTIALSKGAHCLDPI